MKKRVRFLAAALLLALLLTGCSGTQAVPEVSTPAAPAEAPQEGAQPPAAATQSAGGGKELPPTPPVSAPDKSGYEEYAGRFFRALKKGDAF